MRMLDLLQTLCENEEIQFLDLAMNGSETRELMEGIVSIIDELFYLACIHIVAEEYV